MDWIEKRENIKKKKQFMLLHKIEGLDWRTSNVEIYLKKKNNLLVPNKISLYDFKLQTQSFILNKDNEH